MAVISRSLFHGMFIFTVQRLNRWKGLHMIKNVIYAALITERQIPKGMSSHDAQFSAFACKYGLESQLR
jgi:hypothetical protein